MDRSHSDGIIQDKRTNMTNKLTNLPQNLTSQPAQTN